MKSLLVSSALAVAFVVAPAWAQEVSPPSSQSSPHATPQATDDSQWPTTARVVSHVVEGDRETGRTETTTEVIEPTYPPRQIDPNHTISPEAQAAVDAGHDTTDALIQAQLNALGKTPPVQATTVITTTRSTPPVQPVAPG